MGLMQESTRREHIPGATWGIVIDGELAHLGTTGLRDVAAARPVDGDLFTCERGQLRASITLAPTMPPTVQYLGLRAVPSGGEAPPRTCR